MTRRRGGLTLVELIFTLAILGVLFTMIWSFFGAGRGTLESSGRKLDALNRTHLRFESLRHALESSRVAFALAPPPPREGEPAVEGPGGGHGLVAGGREYRFDPAGRGLAVDGRPSNGSYRDLRFWNLPEHTVQLLIAADESRPGDLRGPVHREKSTLVSRVFLEAEAENMRDRAHVFEASHRWCVDGAAVHYGLSE